MSPAQLFELLVSGAAMGCIYALIGLGFTTIMRATGVLHFAQGEIVMLGAMAGLSVLGWQPSLPFPIVLLAGIVFAGASAALIEILIYRRLRARGIGNTNMIIATVGVSIVLQNVARLVWGSESRPYPKLFEADTYHLGSAQVSPQLLWVVALGSAVMLALQWFLARTRTGRAMQASAQDADAARLMGINVERSTTLTFALSGALGGAAGVLLASMFYASFGMGFLIGLKSFVAATLGGLGSIGGAVLGGLVFGLIETFASVVVSTEYRDAIGMVVLVLILLVAPQGLIHVLRGKAR